MAIFGFLGTGNMGAALARAAGQTLGGDQILLSNRTAAKAETLARELGCQAVDNRTAAERADFLFLGVKPQMMEDLLTDISGVLAARRSRFVLVTMAAGLTMERVRSLAHGEYPVIRIMPNTPVSIGQGVVLYAHSKDVTEDELNVWRGAMAQAGRLVPLPEGLIDAGSAVSGCGPAFVDIFIESLADGGVACGLPRSAALELAAQMVAGSAQLLLESGRHPGELKDAVCSPGGTTIQGVRKLERSGFRGAVLEAVIAAYEKNRDLG